MRQILFILIAVSILGCTPKQSEKSIVGEWKVKSWVNLKDSSDFLKSANTPEFLVTFKKDSVYILEKDLNHTNDYKFPWNIINDTLSIDRLGVFRIDEWTDEKLVLVVETSSFFSIKKEVHLEEITLIK